MKFVAAALLLAPFATAFECPGEVTVSTAGSTTVEPIARQWATSFENICTAATVTVAGGGSSFGRSQVCAGAVDIGNMSREWRDTEATFTAPYTYACSDGSVTAHQIAVARDGISIVGSLLNDDDTVAVDCFNTIGGLTMDQIRWMWTSLSDTELVEVGVNMIAATPNNNNNGVKEFSDLNAGCPEVEILAIGADGGTQEFFEDTVFSADGEGFAGNVIIYPDNSVELYTALTAAGNNVAYAAFAWYNAFRPLLGASAVIAPSGQAIIPSPTTIGDTYQPLSRRIYMNLDNSKQCSAGEYILYGFTEDGAFDVQAATFVPLAEDEAATMRARANVCTTSLDSKPVTFGLFGTRFFAREQTCGDLGFVSRIFACRGDAGDVCPTQCG